MGCCDPCNHVQDTTPVVQSGAPKSITVEVGIADASKSLTCPITKPSLYFGAVS